MNIRNLLLATLAVMLPCLQSNSVARHGAVNNTVVPEDGDKATADRRVYQLLSEYTGGRLLPKSMDFSKSKLADTNEEGIKIAEGPWFQVNTMRSDIYVDGKTFKPVFGAKYPMESAVNLLMNVVGNDSHRLTITHHQYGNVRKKIMLPLHAIYQILAADKDIYCSVTKIDARNIEANLVMHQPESNYIHLFVIRMPIDELFKKEGMFAAELYSNIPQDNVKSIYSKKERTK